MRGIIAAIAAGALLTACGASHEVDFLTHVGARGVDQGAVATTDGKSIGDAVCADLASGTVAANSVLGVTNMKGGTFNESQAEVIVYWAVTDLCPDKSSQLQAHWRDGS
jgi:hypothetical protein